jgi:uncharacterized protein (TIGR02246 family)
MIAQDVIQQAIRAYFETVCALDAAACAQLFAADARMYNPPGAPPTEGREAIQHALEPLFGACQRLTAEPVQTFINGNGAAVLYRGELTAKAGATVPFEGIDVFEVDATGLIQEIRYYWDPGPVMAALRG